MDKNKVLTLNEALDRIASNVVATGLNKLSASENRQICAGCT
jgi:hypothetical protein